MNSGQNDPSNAVAAAVAAHGGLLQPMSMQNLLAMASMGQPAMTTSANQSISAASMNNVATPLCKYIYITMHICSIHTAEKTMSS